MRNSSAGGQLEQPSEVKSSTTTGTRDCAWAAIARMATSRSLPMGVRCGGEGEVTGGRSSAVGCRLHAADCTLKAGLFARGGRELSGAEVVEVGPLDGLDVVQGEVADAFAGDEVVHLLGEVLGVIAGALQRLRHEDDVDAVVAGIAGTAAEMAHEDEVAQAIDLRIGAQDLDDVLQVAEGESALRLDEH